MSFGRSFTVTLAASGLALGLVYPAGALTLKPGQYKMEWRMPGLDETPEEVLRPGLLKAVDPEQAGKFKGLQSDEPVWTVIDGRTFMLDESDGPATGFDIAYVLPSYKPGDAVDFAGLTPLKLQDQGGVLRSDYRDSPLIDVTVGREGSRVIQKARMRLQVPVTRDEQRGRRPVKVIVSLFGNPAGKIPTDEGEVELQLIDGNANGVFDDIATLDPKTSSYATGDLIAVRKPGGEWNKSPLGKALLYEGKLYAVGVSAVGDRVDIQPCSGPTGVLKCEMRDGKNNLVQAGDVATFRSVELGAIDLKSGEEATVPAGEYRCGPTITFGARKKKGDPGFIATIKTQRAAKVESGKTATFVIGGAVSISIDPEVETLKWVVGSDVKVKVLIHAGEDSLDSLGWPDVKVTLATSDAAGRRLGQLQQDMNLGNPRFYPLKIPATVPLGSYWLTVSLQPGEYAAGETVTAHKAVIVVK